MCWELYQALSPFALGTHPRIKRESQNRVEPTGVKSNLVAHTKRKRRTKHRGNAAGVVETRGRTGRAPSPEERKKQSRTQAREDRLNRRPTWRSAFNRAVLAAGVMFVFLLVTTKKNKLGVATGFAVVALALYVPLGYKDRKSVV